MKDRKSRAVGGCTAGSTSSAQADAGGEIIYDESERESFLRSFPYRNVIRRRRDAEKKEKRRKKERNAKLLEKKKKLHRMFPVVEEIDNVSLTGSMPLIEDFPGSSEASSECP